MPPRTVIRPRVGVNQIRFGFHPQQVLDAVQHTPDVDRDPVDGWMSWDFPHAGLSFHFDQEEDLRLISISCEDQNATLGGRLLVGLPAEDALRVAHELGLGASAREDFDIMWVEEFPDQDVSLWFEDGICTSITWGVLITDEDQYLWPPHAVN